MLVFCERLSVYLLFGGCKLQFCFVLIPDHFLFLTLTNIADSVYRFFPQLYNGIQTIMTKVNVNIHDRLEFVN